MPLPPARSGTADRGVRGGVRPARRWRPHANAPIAPARSRNRNSGRRSAIAGVPAEQRCLASVARLRIVGLLPPKGLQRNRSEPTTAGNLRAARRKTVTSACSRHIALGIHGLWFSPLGWWPRARHTRAELHPHQLPKAETQRKIELKTGAVPGSARASLRKRQQSPTSGAFPLLL